MDDLENHPLFAELDKEAYGVSMDTQPSIMVDGEAVPLTVIMYDPLTGDTQRRYVLDEITQDDLVNARWLPAANGGFTVIINIRSET